MIDKSLKADTGPQLVPGEERRRSQRVMVRTAVTLHYVAQGKQIGVPAYTISVNDHGAMVLSPRDFPVGTRLEIEHTRTGQRVPCHVARASREIGEGFQVPLEFEKPAPGFWHINFPPTA